MTPCIMAGRLAGSSIQSKLFSKIRSGPMMVKLPGLIAKKMLPAQRTRTRAVVDCTFGTATSALPLFGTPVASTAVLAEKRPPVWMSMSTALHETGARSVLATFQVTVSVALIEGSHTALAAGAVTANGPDAASTCSSESALWVVPATATLSKTVRRKVKLRVVVGRISPSMVAPLSRFSKLGIVRIGLAVGLSERMIGPLPGSLARLPPLVAAPRSYCSQPKVRLLPGAALEAEPPR